MAQDCRLALALALDVLGPVDEVAYNLQREALARALLDPELVQAFLTGDPVALYVFECGSSSMQETIGPAWFLVDSEDDLALIADGLRTLPRAGSRDCQLTTGPGVVLVYASTALEAAPDCKAQRSATSTRCLIEQSTNRQLG